MGERQTVNPCPICSSISIDITESMNRPEPYTVYYVKCRNCDFLMAAYGSCEEAVNLWNSVKVL